MADFQREKRIVLDYYAALDGAAPAAAGAVEARFAGAGHVWRGYEPFGEIRDAEEIGARFWGPLKAALTGLQRRMDIFFAGQNVLDQAGVWVVSMGHLMGLLDAPWLGLRPTGKIVMLRYCSFHRVESDRIAETFMYFDLPHLARQAGQPVFGPGTAQHLVQPGPMTHDGLLFGTCPPEEGRATWAAIERMISDLGTWQLGLPLEEELARTWHDDMLWWGPEGIGAAYTIERYAKQHSAPFRAAFSERSSTGHLCRVAEGQYGGFVGWPNFTARLTGPFMGREATGLMGEFRVIDLYRRRGEMLAENWIFIDLLHFWKQQGWDAWGEAVGGENAD